jgi:hypothetical protein
MVVLVAMATEVAVEGMVWNSCLTLSGKGKRNGPKLQGVQTA